MPNVTLTRTTTGPVRPGDPVSFELSTSGDFPEFFGFESSLTYNADELSYLGTDFNPELDTANEQSEPADAVGETTIDAIVGGSFSGDLAGANVVATLNFLALTASDADIRLEGFGGGFFRNASSEVVFNQPVDASVVINTAPVVEDDLANVEQGESITIDVLGNDSDADGDNLSIASVGDAAKGYAVLSGGMIIYTPDEGVSGSDSFTYELSDGLESVTGTVDVTVEPVENTLTAVADTATVAEDASVEIDVLANDSDPDGDMLSIAAVGGASNGSVSQTAGGVTYTPTADFNGDDSFTYDVTDGATTQTVNVDVTVTPVNDDPVAQDDDATVSEGESVEIDVLANDDDVDGDPLSAVVSDGPENGAVTETAGGLTYTPDSNFSGDDSFTYEVSDGDGGTDTATVDVTVTPVTDPPSGAGSVTLTPTIDGFVRPGQTVGFELRTSSDFPAFLGFQTILSYNADALSYTGTTFGDIFTESGDPIFVEPDEPDGASGEITLGLPVLAGLFMGEASGDNLVATLNFTAGGAGDAGILLAPFNDALFIDGDGDIVFSTPVEQTVSINSLALAEDDTTNVDEGSSVAINVLDNDADPDGDQLTVESVGDAAHGAVTLTNDVVTYTPDVGYDGDDSFTYDVSDGKETVTATVDVTVVSLNDAPIASDDTLTIDEDQSAPIPVLANDVDPDGDMLSVESIGQGVNGLVTLTDGVVTYTPNADFNGADSFDYVVSDNNGGTDTGTVNVTVNAVNDAPELTVGDSFDFVERDSGAVFTASASDVDSPDLTFSLSGADSGAFAVDSGAGAVSFAETPTFEDGGDNIFEFAVSVSDGEASASQDVSVTLLKDSDEDLVADNADNAIFAFNPDQRDSNGDGFGNVIDGDFNNDGFVDLQDFALMRGTFGMSGLTDSVDSGFDAADADFDGDGQVGLGDLGAFSGLVGSALGASAFDEIA